MKYEPIADNLLFCTELVGLSVYDTRHKKIGRVRDAALVPLIDKTRVDRFLVGGGWAWLSVRHDQIKSISLRGIYLQDEQLTPYHSDEYMLRLVRDLLDQQIIDSSGRKVVRVTDITFEVCSTPNGDILRVVEVDIGLRSIFRRLLQGMPPRAVRKLQGPIPPKSIAWAFCNIVEPDPQRRLRLNISNDALEKMHPADLADIVEELGPEEREAIIETIDAEVAAETLSEMDMDVKLAILEALETGRAAEIIEEMAPDEAAATLSELEEETSHDILEEMEDEIATEVEELIEYKDDTAGAMMTTEYVALHPEDTVQTAIAAVREQEENIESLNTLLLVDEEGKLVGSVPLGRLVLASGQTPLAELAAEHKVSVSTAEKQNRVTEMFDKYNLLTLAVVDREGKLEGVITADDIIAALRHG